jgi:hypothetical protein
MDGLVALGEEVVALTGLAVPDVVEVGFREGAAGVVDNGGWRLDLLSRPCRARCR